jgi:hypothetical protein
VESLGTVAVLRVGLLAIAPHPRADCGHSQRPRAPHIKAAAPLLIASRSSRLGVESRPFPAEGIAQGITFGTRDRPNLASAVPLGRSKQSE